ncbi:nucleotide exchange factor GrpE [Coleofasciculus sp. G2-EDA-02]|uniref:nucleotide exchange factor GrpE n=1 Tax=Coleofasciculus sp. G2-EDA-02 TaxID=3069529 RepID=UPI0032F81F28
MSDEEKQQNTTLQQTDKHKAVNSDNPDLNEATSEVEVGTQPEVESPSTAEAATSEVTTEGTKTSAGQSVESESAESDSAGLPSQEDVAVIETLKQENELLKAQIEEINQQFEAFKSQSMRMAADFDNFRKRTAKEKEDLEHQVKRNTLGELLSVVDNFERARSHIKPQNDGEMAVHKSYQGIYKQLVEAFKRLGVSPMRPEGMEFDPNFHEAVMRQPSDEYGEGIVIEQLMRGYFLGDRVLRHAMVKVAAAQEPMVTSEEDTSAEPES